MNIPTICQWIIKWIPQFYPCNRYAHTFQSGTWIVVFKITIMFGCISRLIYAEELLYINR